MVQDVGRFAVVDDKIEPLRACDVDRDRRRRGPAANRGRPVCFGLPSTKTRTPTLPRPAVESSMPSSAWNRL